MTTFVVFNKSTGGEITRYAAQQPVEQIDDLAVPFADYDHTPLPDDAEPVQPLDPAQWRIWVGSFFDRFGAAKIGILSDTDPVVQAIVKDASVRRYIDLIERRDELTQAIGLLQAKGHAVDPVAILDVEPVADEVWHG